MTLTDDEGDGGHRDGNDAEHQPTVDESAPSNDPVIRLTELADESAPNSDPVIRLTEDLADLDSTPGSETVIARGPELSPHDKVRKHLALAIMWSLLSIYAATIGVFLVDKLTGNRLSEGALTTTVAAISGLQGLGAAIVGFYFGVQEKSGK